MKKSVFFAGAIMIVTGGGFLLLSLQQGGKENNSEWFLDVNTYPEARVMETVELRNGETYTLTAGFVKKEINGRDVKMLAYNGSIPGPLIKVKQGSEVTINFTNNTDVDSTIHSHGVRVENAFDGVPDVTQDPVKPGELFAYTLKFPDAGVYWYHPHIREDYAQELGLYGNFIVEPEEADYWNPVNREEALFLDDILIENGSISPFDPKTADHTLMGRFGNVMFVNGETDYQVEARMNEVVRFYVTNAANTRTFNVSIPGVKMKLVGGDNGRFEQEKIVQSFILGPSERMIVEALFDLPGSYEMKHASVQRAYQLAAIRVSDNPPSRQYSDEFNSMRVNQGMTNDLDSYRADFAKTPDQSLRLSLTMKSPMGMQGSNQHMMHGGGMMENQMMRMDDPQPIEWEDDMGMMNRDSTTDTLEWTLIDERTGRENMDIDDWRFKVGDRVKLKIFNDPNSMHPMQHPIHIHGQRFLVVSTNGVASDNLVWKDTALIKTGDTVEFLVDIARPGTWMIHCHISEHLEAGMMMKFEVST